MKDKDTADYKKKKKNAQFFTPPELVTKLIDTFKLDFDHKKILEPSCGDGSFIKDMVKYNNKIYAVDIDETKIKKIKNTYKVITITSDFLDYCPKNCFDLVIGNPPFNLKTKKDYCDTTEGFILHGLDLLKPNGELIYILPATVLRTKKYQPLREYLIKNTKIINIMNTKAFDFLGADIETIALHIKKEKVNNQEYVYYNNNRHKKIRLVCNCRSTILLENIIHFNKLRDIIGEKVISDYFNVYRGRAKQICALKGRDLDFYNDTISGNHKEYVIGLQNIAYRLVANVISIDENNISDTITILKPKVKLDYFTLRYIANYLNSAIANYQIQINAFNNSKLTIHVDKYYIDDLNLPDINKIDKNSISNLIEEITRNNKTTQVSDIRNNHFYQILGLDRDLINELNNNWTLPRYKDKIVNGD